jgi:hypothetical protein
MFEIRLRDLLQVIEEKWGKFGRLAVQAILALVVAALLVALWRSIFHSGGRQLSGNRYQFTRQHSCSFWRQ